MIVRIRERRDLAKLALALVEGSLRVGDAADELFIDAFDTVEEAVTAHAYLAGYVLQYLAVQRDETMTRTVEEVRRLLEAVP